MLNSRKSCQFLQQLLCNSTIYDQKIATILQYLGHIFSFQAIYIMRLVFHFLKLAFNTPLLQVVQQIFLKNFIPLYFLKAFCLLQPLHFLIIIIIGLEFFCIYQNYQ